MKLENGQRLDEVLNIDLIRDFFVNFNINGEVLRYVFDVYGRNEETVENLLDYYCLRNEFEEYIKENRKDYEEDYEEDDEEEDD